MKSCILSDLLRFPLVRLTIHKSTTITFLLKMHEIEFPNWTWNSKMCLTEVRLLVCQKIYKHWSLPKDFIQRDAIENTMIYMHDLSLFFFTIRDASLHWILYCKHYEMLYDWCLPRQHAIEQFYPCDFRQWEMFILNWMCNFESCLGRCSCKFAKLFLQKDMQNTIAFIGFH